jgi:hypothetical protein
MEDNIFERLSFACLILAKCRLHAKPLVFAIQYSAARELKVEFEITGGPLTERNICINNNTRLQGFQTIFSIQKYIYFVAIFLLRVYAVYFVNKDTCGQNGHGFPFSE